MKELRKEFTSCGFIFKQVVRENDVAIYSKKQVKHTGVSYEVIRISKHNGYKLGGNFIEPAETYPCNSMWGTSGFTCTSIESAERKYAELKAGTDSSAIVNFKIKSTKPKAGSTQPHLVCLITGAARPTTLKYLTAKAEKYRASVDDIKNYYITKSAVKLINSGMSVEKTRQALGVSIDTVVTAAMLSRALELNGRRNGKKIKRSS